MMLKNMIFLPLLKSKSGYHGHWHFHISHTFLKKKNVFQVFVPCLVFHNLVWSVSHFNFGHVTLFLFTNKNFSESLTLSTCKWFAFKDRKQHKRTHNYSFFEKQNYQVSVLIACLACRYRCTIQYRPIGTKSKTLT